MNNPEQFDFSTPVACADLRKPEIFEQFYKQFSSKIYRYAFLRLSSADDAEELLSTAFLRLWEYVSRDKEINEKNAGVGVVRNLPAFLYRIARNLIIDQYRARAKTPPLSLDLLLQSGFEAADCAPLNTVLRAEHALVLAQFDNLSSDERDLLVLRYVEAVPVKEIAQIYEITENTASVRIYRALQKLKGLLKQSG